MSVEKAYSRRQLITVAEVASAFAAARDIAGLEAMQQLAQAVQDGRLCPDLYPQHQRWVNNGQAERIGNPDGNSAAIWGSLSKKSVERHISDKDDFNYPPAASTWHMLADDVFSFASRGTLSQRASAALRELAVRYKAELGETEDATISAVSANHDSEYLAAWAIHEQIDHCKAAIERWQELERNAKTPSEVITAEQRLVAPRQELADLNRQASGAEVVEPVAEPEQAPPPKQVQAVPAVQPRAMKRAALIAELLSEWPGIEDDLREASRNGLGAAKLAQHGMWNPDVAMEWAKSRGKLAQQTTGMSPATWRGPITRHQPR